jgi:Domain of unknown function (DUF4157)
VPPIVQEVLRAPGQPLDPSIRAYLEPRFGYDFSQVRVHTDARAAESARAVNARAYTVGRNIAFGTPSYAPHTAHGLGLLAHELTHVVQQGHHAYSHPGALAVNLPGDAAEVEAASASRAISTGSPAPGISCLPGAQVLQRQKFEPWPGQKGTDVPGTRQQSGSIISERIQRTGDPNYASLQPILLEFNQSTCTLTATMEINFVPPADPKAKLSVERFNSLKARMLSVANDKLNGWMKIQVNDDKACSMCRGKTIAINVVAREGSGAFSSTVELRRGTGRANAGQIFAGGDDWLSDLLGGVSDGTLWHESGHIVLGLPDEYPPPSGDPPRPAQRITTSDWSAMSEESSYGRRAEMHPRHFSFMTEWLARRFPSCKFSLAALPRPIVIDVVTSLRATGLATGGQYGIQYGLDISAGFPLGTQRRLRLLVGGYGDLLMTTSYPSRMAFMAGALVGLDYSTNRSGGGFAAGLDVRGGGALITSGVPEAEKGKWVPTVGTSLTLGYAGPRFELGATVGVGKFLSGSWKDDPYFNAGLKAGLTF